MEKTDVRIVEGSLGVGGTLLAHCCFCEAIHPHQLAADEKKQLNQNGEVVTSPRTANCQSGEYKVHVTR